MRTLASFQIQKWNEISLKMKVSYKIGDKNLKRSKWSKILCKNLMGKVY